MAITTMLTKRALNIFVDDQLQNVIPNALPDIEPIPLQPANTENEEVENAKKGTPYAESNVTILRSAQITQSGNPWIRQEGIYQIQLYTPKNEGTYDNEEILGLLYTNIKKNSRNGIWLDDQIIRIFAPYTYDEYATEDNFYCSVGRIPFRADYQLN